VKELLKLQAMPIGELVEYKLNAKLHPPAQIKQIENSIKKFGMNDPIAIDEMTKVIIEGHGRLMACRNLGIKEVPVITLSHLDEKQQRAYRIAHNKINMNSGFDNDILLQDIRLLTIEEIGFTGLELPDIKLLLDNDMPSPKDLSDRIINSYEIIISCENESDTQELYDRLKEEGLKCRISIF
jgi:ParB-like chromosome segregation protein Spo0J